MVPELTENVDAPAPALVIASASRPLPPTLTVLVAPLTLRLALPVVPMTLANTALAAVGGVLFTVVPLSVSVVLALLPRLFNEEPAVVVMVVPV